MLSILYMVRLLAIVDHRVVKRRQKPSVLHAPSFLADSYAMIALQSRSGVALNFRCASRAMWTYTSQKRRFVLP